MIQKYKISIFLLVNKKIDCLKYQMNCKFTFNFGKLF